MRTSSGKRAWQSPGITPVRLAILLLACAVFALSAAAATRGPSTEEERQRVITITHKLEVSPLDVALFPERDWAQQWLLEVPDVRILSCTGLLQELRRPRYKYRLEMWAQLRLASAVFIIEHPDRAGDRRGESLAGMQSLLKAYSAIIKTDPAAHSAFLDDLLVKESQGKLPDFVREATKACHF